MGERKSYGSIGILLSKVDRRVQVQKKERQRNGKWRAMDWVNKGRERIGNNWMTDWIKFLSLPWNSSSSSFSTQSVPVKDTSFFFLHPRNLSLIIFTVESKAIEWNKNTIGKLWSTQTRISSCYKFNQNQANNKITITIFLCDFYIFFLKFHFFSWCNHEWAFFLLPIYIEWN